jgi:predicted N-acyltransferase
MNALLDFGYRRVATPPMHSFSARFQDFDDYCAGLRSNYRRQVMRSIEKFRQCQVHLTVLADAQQIVLLYTPEVHNLYYQVVDNADLRFERLSIDFFRQLASRLEGHVELILFSQGERIIGFVWGLEAASIYYLLYMGFDHELSADLDLYFNMVYAALAHALGKRVAKIQVGQAAGTFKARLGCHSEPLYMFIKGRGAFLSFFVRYGSHLLIAQEPAIPAFNVFKRAAFETSQAEQ